MDAPRPLLLVFPFGYLSHYLRCLVLCKELRKHFEIRFAGHESYSSFTDREGYGSFWVDSLDEGAVLSQVRSFDFSWLNERSLERSFLSQAAVIEKLQPAAVLGDAMPTLKMAAAYAGVPFISLLNGYMSPYYADARCLSRTHPAYPYLMKLPPAIRKFMTTQGEALAMRAVHKPFRKLRAKYGLPAQRSYLDELEGDHNLLCDLPSLFPQKALPRHYTSIGPLLYDEPGGAALSGPLNPGKKTILVSMGSTGDWSSVRFLNEARYRAYNIVAAGDRNEVLYAPHIIRTPFIAARNILPFTDLVICHGGNGTLYQALSYGVPILCRPAHFEQEWNVAALEQAGLAGCLDRVCHPEDHPALIGKWADRKGLPLYTDVRARIAEAVAEQGGKLTGLRSAIRTPAISTAPPVNLAI